MIQFWWDLLKCYVKKIFFYSIRLIRIWIVYNTHFKFFILKAHTNWALSSTPEIAHCGIFGAKDRIQMKCFQKQIMRKKKTFKMIWSGDSECVTLWQVVLHLINLWFGSDPDLFLFYMCIDDLFTCFNHLGSNSNMMKMNNFFSYFFQDTTAYRLYKDFVPPDGEY